MINATVIPYERRHRNAVLNLRFYSQRTCAHLDWHRPITWLDKHEERVFLLYHGDRLLGFMGISEAMHRSAWIRLLALHDSADAESTLRALWQESQHYLQTQHTDRLFVLVSENWLTPHLPAIGFTQHEMVITLYRKKAPLPVLQPHQMRVRDIYFEDLNTVLAIDNSAFPAPWQMSREDLYQAIRISASATLALRENQVVGYQISTRHQAHGHLARLAVNPALQGQGIAKVLLHHLINRMERRGMRSMSVNTQDTNIRSQRLYEQFGFQRNFYDLPVFVAQVQESA